MAEITAALVRELREKTGAGMMDCKKALQETAGELDAAVDWLRKKGLAAAAKKAARVAAEGLVAARAEGRVGTLLEVNSETDFVARNDKFQAFVETVVHLVPGADGDLERLKASGYPGSGRNVADELTQLVATIGENLQLRRCAQLRVTEGVVAAYVHGASAPGLGRIGVLVGVQSSGEAGKLMALGRQLAMHVAAAQPQSLDIKSLDPKAVERERSILMEQAAASGKAANIVEKMAEGRLRKFYQDVVLLEQTWVHDGESKVADVLSKFGKELGQPVSVTGFRRFVLGEGIERAEKDFAAEVAAAGGR
ncbi:MAG: elongation factor Ts [Alphaproteobacteria bacterium]|nr:elongation factor Ts [Alphaproteobacteria bacterium]